MIHYQYIISTTVDHFYSYIGTLWEESGSAVVSVEITNIRTNNIGLRDNVISINSIRIIK